MESKTVMVIVENTQFSGTETLCDPWTSLTWNSVWHYAD